MLAGLLSLALIGIAVPVGFRVGVGPATVWLHPHLISPIKSSPQTSFLQSPQDPRSEREWIDEDDSSDESSSSKERTAKVADSKNRHARSLFRTSRQHTAARAYNLSLLLFYVYCALLI